ncbi:hypothetical protein DL769_000275 [Monosporascus sp. CRB-8-3]|nr:hypothetical protein DL769_000275 [Monosporascus sp. CRB-8-3]
MEFLTPAIKRRTTLFKFAHQVLFRIRLFKDIYPIYPLALQGELRDILLRTPDEGEKGFDPFYLLDISRFVKSQREIPATRLAFPSSLLSTATSLRLRRDTDRDDRWHGVLPTYFPFWGFGGVTRLEHYRDAADGNEVLRHLDDEDPADNQALENDSMAKAMHQIEELRSYSSRMAPWSMRQLLSHCPNLRSPHWASGRQRRVAHPDVEPLEKNTGSLHLTDVLPPNLEKLVLIEK